MLFDASLYNKQSLLWVSRRLIELAFISVMQQQLCNAVCCNAMYCNARYHNATCQDAMLCFTMQCITMFFNAVHYNAMYYNAMCYDAMYYSPMFCNAVHYNVLQCCVFNAVYSVHYCKGFDKEIVKRATSVLCSKKQQQGLKS